MVQSRRSSYKRKNPALHARHRRDQALPQSHSAILRSTSKLRHSGCRARNGLTLSLPEPVGRYCQESGMDPGAGATHEVGWEGCDSRRHAPRRLQPPPRLLGSQGHRRRARRRNPARRSPRATRSPTRSSKTRATAVLFQNGQRVEPRFDLTQTRSTLPTCSTSSTAHTEPDIEGFEQAVEEFKERVPELAQGLVKAKIEAAHKNNKKFQAAFDTSSTSASTRSTRTSARRPSMRCWSSTSSPSG